MIDENSARIIEAEAKAQSAKDLFEGEKDALNLQLSTAEGKLKGLQALQGADAAGWEKKVRVGELEDRLEQERIRLNKEIAVGKEDLDLEKKKLLNATNRDQKDLALVVKEKHELTMALEKEKNKRLDVEKRLDTDRKNFDKLKFDFEERIDTFRNRNTDIEDELRREIATLQKLIETLREQVQFERKRREVHDVNVASKTTTALVGGALAKGADRYSTSMAGMSKHL